MVRKSLFDLFLFFSIIAILIGIALIIFIQFDRGYVVSDTHDNADFEQQQNRLIKYLHESTDTSGKDGGSANQALAKINSVPAQPETSEHPPAVASQTLKLQTNTSTAAVAGSSSSAANQSEHLSHDEYERYWLSQNPWSPDYHPAY